MLILVCTSWESALLNSFLMTFDKNAIGNVKIKLLLISLLLTNFGSTLDELGRLSGKIL